MNRSTNMVHVEVLRHMKETIKAIALSEVAALDAAIAALSAPQPPAEAQAQGGGEVVAEVVLHNNLLYGRLSRDLPVGAKLYTAPPSSPVGVEASGEGSDDLQLDAVMSTAAIAWGWLRHVTEPDDRVETARHLLGQMLNKDLKRYGIQTAKAEGARVNMQGAETQQPVAKEQPCGCGEATCTVPWEPGCGLGKSEKHAEAPRCTCPSGDGSLRWPCPAHPAEAQPVEPMTGDLLPCPFCGKSNQDRYPCEWLDGSGANVIRCAWCHGAAPMNTWNRRIAPPSAPVGVEGGPVHVGNLPTLNQDGYPGLAQWWVQLWRGDEIIARVYGDSPDEARSQAQDIADALAHQPAPSAPVGVVGVRHEIQNALRELDAVMTAEDNTSDAVGCAELALQRALEALDQHQEPTT